MDDLNQAVEYIQNLAANVSKEGKYNHWYGNKIKIPSDTSDGKKEEIVIEISIQRRTHYG